MKRILRIMQSHFYINASGSSWLFPVFIIILVFIAIVQCLMITQLVSQYVNGHTGIIFTSIFGQMVSLINMSSILTLNVLIGSHIHNRKKKNNYPLFLLQLPVYKKDLFTARFLILQLGVTPPLVCTLYFIGLNLFVGSSDYISAYSGFFTAIYSLWLIVLSTSIGFAVSCSKKYKFFKYFTIIPIVLMLIFLFIISNVEPIRIVNEYNMYSGLGERFAPIVKACRVIGGVWGIAVILITTVISYLLSSKLPVKLSEKEV